MCFSATASFVASGVLGTTGIATISKASKKELPVACIPLLFALQQFSDGVVWVSSETSLAHFVAVYLYAFLAFAFWPTFVPFALLLIESHQWRRRVLAVLLLVGGGVSSIFIRSIVTGGAESKVVGSCIAYWTVHPYGVQLIAFYIIAVCGAFFVSSQKVMRVFGVVLLLSLFIARLFYIKTFSSTWCFFAALLSAILLFYFYSKSSKSVTNRRLNIHAWQ